MASGITISTWLTASWLDARKSVWGRPRRTSRNSAASSPSVAGACRGHGRASAGPAVQARCGACVAALLAAPQRRACESALAMGTKYGVLGRGDGLVLMLDALLLGVDVWRRTAADGAS